MDPFSDFINTGGWEEIKYSIMTSCWKSQSQFRSFEGNTEPLQHATACFKSPPGCGMVTSFLFFPSFGCLCSLMFPKPTCIALVIIEVNRKNCWKRKVWLLFRQETAYLENHDASVSRSASSCDWLGSAGQCVVCGRFYDDSKTLGNSN